MNITKKEALILGQLAASAGSELYGLQMVKASDDQLKLGTVYVTLGRLEEKGFVEGRREEASERTVPRRLYKITGAGRRTFQAWRAAMAAYDQELGGAIA
jgi:DNA-binding PadR family transcriptional regulator